MLPPQRDFSWSPSLKYNSDCFLYLTAICFFVAYVTIRHYYVYYIFMLVLFLLNISSKRTRALSVSWCLVVFNKYSLNEKSKELPFLLPRRNWVKQKYWGFLVVAIVIQDKECEVLQIMHRISYQTIWDFLYLRHMTG